MSNQESPQELQIGECVLNTLSGEVKRSGQSAFLDHTPLQLLLCLISSNGEVVSKDKLLTEVWRGKVVGEDVLSVAVSQIRKALGDNPRRSSYIKTISGKGYQLIVAPTPLLASSLGTSVETVRYSIWKLVGLAGVFVLALGLWFAKPTKLGLDLSQLSQAEQDDYRQARFLLSQPALPELRRAEQQFRMLINQQPQFAPAYLGLVKARLKLMSGQQQAKIAALPELYALLDKGLRLNSEQASFHFQVAQLAFLQEWNIDKAQQHFSKALALEPTNAELHFAYSQFLLARRDFNGAIKHVNLYRDFAPEAYEVPSIAWIYNMMEDFPNALVELEKLQELRPDSFVLHVSRQSILENMGQYDQSFEAMLAVFDAVEYSELEKTQAQSIYSQDGLEGVYHWLLVEKKEQRNIGQYRPPLSFARYAAKAGDIDLATKYLQAAYREKQVELLWVNVDPKYKPVRELDEFKSIVAKIGL